MRFVGFRRDGAIHVGALTGDGTAVAVAAEVTEFWADPYAAARRAAGGPGPVLPLASLDLVPPVLPSARILCVGLNYPAHVEEGPFEAPDYPTVFGRWQASLAVSGTPVAIPVDEAGLDWEGELVAAVGRPCRTPGPKRPWPRSSPTPRSTTSPRGGRRSSPRSGQSARTPTTAAPSPRW